MQQRPPAAPSAGFNVLLAILLGAVGLYNLFIGATRDGAGVLISGIAMAVYAVALLRDALALKKTGAPVLSRKRMNQLGLACLAVYVLGVLVRRVPELAQLFG